jgi:hypothetical protein
MLSVGEGNDDTDLVAEPEEETAMEDVRVVLPLAPVGYGAKVVAERVVEGDVVSAAVPATRE